MLSSQSASNPKILLFLFCFKCRNSFCLRRFLASSAGYSRRRLQLYGRPPPIRRMGFAHAPPRISIAPHQLVRRREKFLRSEFNFLKLSRRPPPPFFSYLGLSSKLKGSKRAKRSGGPRLRREGRRRPRLFSTFSSPSVVLFLGRLAFTFGPGKKGGESLKGGSVDEFWGAERRRKWAKKSLPPPSLPAKCLPADLSRLKVATYVARGVGGGKNVSQQEMRKPAPPSSVSNAVNQVEEEGSV